MQSCRACHVCVVLYVKSIVFSEHSTFCQVMV